MKAIPLSLFQYINNRIVQNIVQILIYTFLLVSLHIPFVSQGQSIDLIESKRRIPMSYMFTGQQLDAGSKLSSTFFLTEQQQSCLIDSTVIRNTIKMRISPNMRKVFTQPFQFDLALTVRTNTDVDIKGTPITLSVSYDPAAGKTYKDIDVYRFKGADVVQIDIAPTTNARPNPKIGGPYTKQNIWDYIELYNEAELDVYYNFNAVNTVQNFRISTTEAGHLGFNWDKVCSATEYDVEYLYIDDYDFENNTVKYLPKNALKYDFSRGATRVTVSDPKYRIPAVFEHGYLLCRVRPVAQWGNTDKRLLGRWTNTSSTGLLSVDSLNAYTYFINNAHEQDKKNWQLIATFAEDSLRKDVVSYYDGSYRKRQTVTKTSTTDRAIVAESIYDYQGRPAINILPAPVEDNVLRYYSNFNQNTEGIPYSKLDFDLDANCKTAIKQMKSDARSASLNVGAANYYSPYNPLVNREEGKAIPQAGGYPFSVTRYLADNTGRVKSQSGIGAVYLDSVTKEMKHATQYYYGTPDQEELDRLFGSEVGKAIHYKKNVVQDANGQFSVSYIDADGKTIATALAGMKPSNVDSLSFKPFDLDIDLMAKNRIDTFSNSLIATKAHTVTSPNNYTFKYRVSPTSFTTIGGKKENLCYDCIYDLELIIQKEGACDTLVNYKKTLGAIFAPNSTNVSRVCDAPAVYDSISITKFLDAGTYFITKRLVVNENAVNKYVEDYLSTFKTVVKDSLIKKALATVDTTGCDVRCVACEEEKGDKEMSYESLLDMVQQARQVCDTTARFGDISRDMMLSDMTPPYGQYALVALNETNSADAIAVDSLSIFNPNNFLSTPNAQWRHANIVFEDEYGQPDSILNTEGVLVPPNHPSIPLQTFVREFKPSWAEALLPYHPEYGLLEWANGMSESDNFDYQMQSTDKWITGIARPAVPNPQNNLTLAANAASMAYGNSVVTFGIVDNDPYFKTPTYGQNDKTAFLNRIKSFATEGGTTYNTLQTAILAYSCPNAYTSNQRENCLKSYTFGIKPVDDDSIWINFFALYNAEKQKFTIAARTRFANGKNFCTECIGAYNKLRSDAIPYAPCDPAHAGLYWNKVKRFPTANDAVVEQTGGVDIYNMDSTQFKTLQNKVIKDNKLSCASCALEDDWVTFINGYLASKTAIPNSETINMLRCRYLNRDLFENLGRPESLIMTKEENGSVLSFALPTGYVIMRWTRGSEQPWVAGSSVQINTSWSSNSETYNLFKVSVKNPDATIDTDNNITLLTPLKNPCYVEATVYVEYQFPTAFADDINLSNGDVSFTIFAGKWNINDKFYGDLIDINEEGGNVIASWAAQWDGNPNWRFDRTTNKLVGGTPGKRYGNLPVGFLISRNFIQYSTKNKFEFDFSKRDKLADAIIINSDNFTNLKSTLIAPNVYELRDSLQKIFPQWNWIIDTINTYINIRSDMPNAFDIRLSLMNSPDAYKHNLQPNFPNSASHSDSVIYQFDAALQNKSVAFDWSIDNQSYRLNFDFTTPSAIAAAFNAVNSAGNWQYDSNTRTLKGKKIGNTYSNLTIYASDNGFAAQMSSNYNSSRLANGYTFNFPYTSTVYDFAYEKAEWFYGTERRHTIYNISGFDALMDSLRKIDPAGNWIGANAITNNTLGYNAFIQSGFYNAAYLGSSIQVSIANAGIFKTQPSYIINGQPVEACAASWLNPINSSCSSWAARYDLAPIGNFSTDGGRVSYIVEWSIACDTFSESVSSMAHIVDFMKKYDPATNWAFDTGTFKMQGLIKGDKRYGELKLYNYAMEGLRQGAPINPLYTLQHAIAPIVSSADLSSIPYSRYNAFAQKRDTLYLSTGCTDCGTPQYDLSPTVKADSISPCAAQIISATRYSAEWTYKLFEDSARTAIRQQYINKCLANVSETFNMQFKTAEYHYTLYYYDQANNLVKTVPPAGVNIIAGADSLRRIKQYRNTGMGTAIFNPHRLTTIYHYNSLNQVVRQKTPDAGISNFYYDRLGRLVLSQNAKQYRGYFYSYTLFDDLGRIKEVGEMMNLTLLNRTVTKTDTFRTRVQYDSLVTLKKDTTVAVYKTATMKLFFRTVTYTYRQDSTYSISYQEKRRFERDTVIYKLTSTLVHIPKSEALWADWLTRGTKRQITRTQYDVSLNPAVATLFGSAQQENLRNRVTSSTYWEQGNSVQYQHATHYSYDILGNVKVLIQDYPGFGQKRMDYRFDQLSGKVNLVAYQTGQRDAFYHRYCYDADLRLKTVETSRDLVIWDNEATYKYYRHGPLRRMELGHDKIQGLDYYYTLQGWIKGVNHGAGGADSVGRDGKLGTIYANFAQDAFAYNLSYHEEDYRPIHAGFNYDFADMRQMFKTQSLGFALYNGNIRAMWGGLEKDKFAVPTNSPIPATAQGQFYRYDQLNRLISARDYVYREGFSVMPLPNNHTMTLSYDGNGNIQTLLRNGTLPNGSSGSMDNLRYNYIAGTNKLSSVTDNVAPGLFQNDIDNQGANNYTYDEIGNLIADRAEGITSIQWNVYGKMTAITNATPARSLTFAYDAAGNRVMKRDGRGKMTYYVRDAQGNVMAVYEKATATADIIASSFYIYGSSRIGELDENVNMRTAVVSTTRFSRIRGQRRYELSNHLGNVMAVVSDRKVIKAVGRDTLYFADLVSATDYYAFGMVMSDRSFNTEGYRYGFNGKENDNEVKGTGNQQDYGMRIYDARLGRFLSVDPLTDEYPHYTPYQFASNTPIGAIDLDGAEGLWSAIVGGGLEIAGQVAVDYFVKGKTFNQAVKNIDWLDVGKATLEGAINPAGAIAKRYGKVAKFAYELGSEYVGAKLDYRLYATKDENGNTVNSGFSVNEDAIENAVIAYGAGQIAGKIVKSVISKYGTSAVTEATKNLRKAKNSLSSSNKPKLSKVKEVETATKQLETVKSANKIVKNIENEDAEKAVTETLKKTAENGYSALRERQKQAPPPQSIIKDGNTFWLQPDGSYIRKTTTEYGITRETTPNKPQSTN